MAKSSKELYDFNKYAPSDRAEGTCSSYWCFSCRAPFPGKSGNARITPVEKARMVRDSLFDCVNLNDSVKEKHVKMFRSISNSELRPPFLVVMLLAVTLLLRCAWHCVGSGR